MSALDLREGDVFQGYKIQKALGKGGMGAVYLAHHPRFDALVALKVMTITAATPEDMHQHRTRFQREARTMMALHHQNVVQVYDIGDQVEDDGSVSPFIVMQYFPGQDGVKWAGGKPTLDRVKNVAIQLADALGAAHDAGFLHRDIKHANILINEKDRAVLIDFGIAKGNDDEDVTKTGNSVGTLTHMAPELFQVANAHSPKTDLYAFGCLLYFLTTQRSVYSGKDIGDLLRRIQHETYVPVKMLRPEASNAWSAVIDDLLRKDPARRINSARELVQRLIAVDPIDHNANPDQPAERPTEITAAAPAVISRPSSSGSGVFQNSPAPPAATVQSRIKRTDVSNDDPFEGAVAQAPAPPSDPRLALVLPPLDGTGIETQLHAAQQAAVVAPVPVEAPAAAPALAPAVAAAPTPAAMPTSQPVVAAPPVLAAPVQPAVVRADLDTYMFGPGAGAPQVVPAPSPAPQAPPQAQPAQQAAQPATDPEPTPQTGSFAFASEQSVVQPLPTLHQSAPPPAPASKKAALRGVAAPVIIIVAILVVGVGVSSLFSKPTAQPVKTATAAAEDDALKKAEERAKKDAEEIEKEKKRAAATPVVMPLPSSPPPPPPAPSLQTAPVPAQPAPPRPVRSVASAAGAPAVVPAAPEAPPVDPALARYAGRAGFNTGSFGSGGTSTPTAAAAAAAAAPTAGVRIPVKVDAEITSANSPVIATVTKETRVGALLLRVGTQIHGTSSGGQGARVEVRFKFAIVDGKNVPISGIALGQDQRAGLPGVRSMGNGTDVAAAALGGAANAATNVVAELAGDNPGAAALRNGGAAAAGKTQRLNSDENIVVVKRGARFMVYVGG